MSRSLFAFLVLAAVIPQTDSLASGHARALKNPVEIRVTSAEGASLPFHVETRGGVLIHVGADGRWYDEAGGARTTPAQLRAFPQGPGLLLSSNHGQLLHVEAWRMLGDTQRTSADGRALVVRVASPRSPPEVVPAGSNTVP
jgi:hypothetical protein